ncbi:MAG: hypothetical protein Q8R20_03600 [Nanoarchaeota archaeon]|nr:hypothetical protein [Nanoarchaeota archaeon]
MEISRTTKFVGAYAAISVLLRLLPHPPNIVPMGALALFAGARGKTKWSMGAPLAAMAISDLVIGLYNWKIMAVVYGSFFAAALLGRVIKKDFSAEKTVIATFAGGVIFFLATNVAVWAFSPWYAKNLAGLLESLMMGLPFWRNSMIGDLFYGAIFFGIYALAERKAWLGKSGAGQKTIYNKGAAVNI